MSVYDLYSGSNVMCVFQLDSLKKDLKLVRLTLERDCTALPTATNNNNNDSQLSAGDAALASDSRRSLQADLSVNDELTRSPSPSLTRNVKRRSTVPKGSVTLCIFLSLCLCWLRSSRLGRATSIQEESFMVAEVGWWPSWWYCQWFW